MGIHPPCGLFHFVGQATYARGNPLASAQTSTQNAAKVAQPEMNMPRYVPHPTAMAYSMHSAYPHERIQVAAFGYIEPQYARYVYTPNYNSVQTQNVASLNILINISAS